MFIIPRTTPVTCLVLYWRPSYAHILQEFIWQTDDSIPEYPRIKKFLRFWKTDIDAIIKDVQVTDSHNDFQSLDLLKVFQPL